MPGVNVQGTGHDDGVYIFHVEQPAVIVKGLNARDLAFRLVAAAAIHVCHRHKFDAMDSANLPQQIIAAVAHADHADADAIIRPQHRRGWIRQHRSCSHRGLLQKRASGLIRHSHLSLLSPVGLFFSNFLQQSIFGNLCCVRLLQKLLHPRPTLA